MNKTMLRFRIWNHRTKEWIKGYKEAKKFFHGFCNDPKEDKNLGLSFWRNPDDYYRICKSTGIKDKKDVEIFEGDIVEIQFKTHKERVEIENTGSWFSGSGLANTNWEVIGNIYENKDLLKSEEGKHGIPPKLLGILPNFI